MHGIELSSPNNKGQIPLSLARQYNDPHIVHLINSAMIGE